MNKREMLLAIASFNAGMALQSVLIYYDFEKAQPVMAAILVAVIVTALAYGTMRLFRSIAL